MIWLITIPLALVAAYSVLCLLINTGTGSASRTPYWLLLVTSAAILYLVWFHPIRITFS